MAYKDILFFFKMTRTADPGKMNRLRTVEKNRILNFKDSDPVPTHKNNRIQPSKIHS